MDERRRRFFSAVSALKAAGRESITLSASPVELCRNLSCNSRLGALVFHRGWELQVDPSSSRLSILFGGLSDLVLEVTRNSQASETC